MEVIYNYTSNQAVEDGILFDIAKFNPAWKKSVFSHITTNLLSTLGYMNEDVINVPNLLDLLNQANEIISRKRLNYVTRRKVRKDFSAKYLMVQLLLYKV